MTIARALDDHFSEGELRMLVAELDYPWEHLTGESRAERALDLVEAMERRDRVGDLVAIMRRERPRMQIEV